MPSSSSNKSNQTQIDDGKHQNLLVACCLVTAASALGVAAVVLAWHWRNRRQDRDDDDDEHIDPNNGMTVGDQSKSQSELIASSPSTPENIRTVAVTARMGPARYWYGRPCNSSEEVESPTTPPISSTSAICRPSEEDDFVDARTPIISNLQRSSSPPSVPRPQQIDFLFNQTTTTTSYIQSPHLLVNHDGRTLLQSSRRRGTGLSLTGSHQPRPKRSLSSSSSTEIPPFNLDHALQHSKQKLEETASFLRPFCQGASHHLKTEPCTCKEEAQGYRCRFTLQVICQLREQRHGEPDHHGHHQWILKFAIRKNREPIALQDGGDSYHIATPALRELMSTLINELNEKPDHYSLLTTNLTSVSFLSSWDPSRTRLVTLHYDVAVDGQQDRVLWIAQADALRDKCRATVISGRAKRMLLRTSAQEVREGEESEVGTDDHILLQEHLGWKVSAHSPSSTLKDTEGHVVHLFKPEGAFCHPNANVMYRALSWILSRLASIRLRHGFNYQVRMLELYCGCGAHTVPLARSGLVSDLVAVEMDDRLVEACRRNIQDNGLEAVASVVSADATKWVASMKQKSSSEKDKTFDVLLVDPPRQGLDSKVLTFAVNESNKINDIIYISCGREALVRDLGVLKSHFEPANCTLLDLFPGTDSVESLVHLRRLNQIGTI